MFPLKHFRYFQNFKIYFDVVDLRIFEYLENFNKSIEIIFLYTYKIAFKLASEIFISFVSKK